MSAYIVDHNHIGYLVQAATSRAINDQHSSLSWTWNIDHEAGTYDRETLSCSPGTETANRVGQMLMNENAESVAHRYDQDEHDSLVFDDSETPRFHEFDACQVLSSCDCFEYQSCEHPGWAASEAKAFIDALRKAAWTSLPGYKDASWGYPKDAVYSAPQLAY